MLKKLFTSTLLYTIGGVLPMLSSLVLVFPYTQQLAPGDYGLLAIYISFTLLVQIIVNYGIDNYISVHYFEYKDNPEQLKKFIGTMVILLMIIGAIFTLFMAISGGLIFSFVFRNKVVDFFPFGFMSVITAICNALFRTYTTLLIYRQKPWRFLWFNLFNFVATIVISVIGLQIYPHAITGPMWGRLLSGVGIFLLSILFYISEYGIAFDKTKLSGVQKFCTPVLIFTLLTWVMSYINIYILPKMNDVGIYDIAIKFTLFIEFTQNGLCNAINPKIYHLWKDGNLTHSTPEENKYHHLFTLVTIMLVALSIFGLPILVTLIVKNQAYYAALTYIPYIAAGCAFRAIYNIFTNPVYYFKKTSLLPRMFVVSAFIQVVLGIVLIKYFGVWGAIWSTLLVKPMQIIVLWMGTKELFDFKFNITKVIILPVVYIVGMFAIYQLPGGGNYIIPGSLQLVWAIILILIAFRKEIDQVPLLFKK
jgi:O-antigen/teichoic acid export membrane protein